MRSLFNRLLSCPACQRKIPFDADLCPGCGKRNTCHPEVKRFARMRGAFTTAFRWKNSDSKVWGTVTTVPAWKIVFFSLAAFILMGALESVPGIGKSLEYYTLYVKFPAGLCMMIFSVVGFFQRIG